MRITEAARRLGLTPRMLRYRESLGLLPALRHAGRRRPGRSRPPAPATDTPHRQFSDADLAAVALAVVSTKDPEHFRTTPGGYFHGIMQKAKAGELHLERTVWALRRAGQPETRREAGQGRGP